jgi:hypothetical protein
MRKTQIICVILLGLLAVAVSSGDASAQRRSQQRGAVCGDPTRRCRTADYEFKPWELPFSISRNAVLWESEEFYAVILKSMRDERVDGTVFVPEEERLAAQQLFPRNKVFASRGVSEPGEIYYSNVDGAYQIMAVYAGRTRAEARVTLAKVKATGKFPGANLRRMHIGFNGT